MAKSISGNTRGLASSQLKRLDRLSHRSLARDEVVSLDLARELAQVASDLRRRVGLLVSREGLVEEVVVGTKEILYLPDLGRYRLGRGRLRRLRLIFSDLSNSPEVHIPGDIYTDLEKLRLDMVVAVKSQGNRTALAFANLVPSLDPSTPAVATEVFRDLNQCKVDFNEFIGELEEQLSQLEATRKVTNKPQAILVGVYPKSEVEAERSMAELEELAATAGVEVRDIIIQRREPDPKTLIGKGKLEEVVLRCLRLGADLIIFDTELRPSQWRIITNSTELKVIDRSMLILDIFAQHAASSDGRLQVELAQLKYNLPRLVEKDAGLSRLTGGIGGRGPGETKLEIGRRRIRDKIIDLEKRINKLGEERQLRRQRRQENILPLVAILGYTNVGKSTLFNALTGSEVLVENKLFATLDPAQRRLVIPHSNPADNPAERQGAMMNFGTTLVLSDTVGFIRNLPEELKSAFRATLEELLGAQVLLHVIDASDPDIRLQFEAVEQILEEMSLTSIPRITVINKIDLVSSDTQDLLVREFSGIAVSAKSKQGFDDLKRSIVQTLQTLKPDIGAESAYSS